MIPFGPPKAADERDEIGFVNIFTQFPLFDYVFELLLTVLVSLFWVMIPAIEEGRVEELTWHQYHAYPVLFSLPFSVATPSHSRISQYHVDIYPNRWMWNAAKVHSSWPFRKMA